MGIKVFVAQPDDEVRKSVFSPETIAEMNRRYDVTWSALQRQMSEEEMCSSIGDADVLVTGWGSGKITDRVLDSAPNLKLVAHTGGTIRYLVDEDFYRRGIPIINANKVMANAVAEYCLLVAMMGRWNIAEELERMKGGGWHSLFEVVPGLMGSTAGIIDYGDIADSFIYMLQALKVQVRVYAPYLTEDFARRKGFELADINEVMQCDIVSVHSTLTESSYHSIDAGKLAMMKDGALLINSARGAVIDEEALIRELKSGRIKAALDVYENEPLPKDHILRNKLPNVINTPHFAAASAYWRFRQGISIMNDIETVLSGGKTANEITHERYLRLSPSYH